jgi:hypothetical protein
VYLRILQREVFSHQQKQFCDPNAWREEWDLQARMWFGANRDFVPLLKNLNRGLFLKANREQMIKLLIKGTKIKHWVGNKKRIWAESAARKHFWIGANDYNSVQSTSNAIKVYQIMWKSTK